MFSSAKMYYSTQKHLIQRKNVLSNAKTSYPTQKRVIQRNKRAIQREKFYQCEKCYPTPNTTSFFLTQKRDIQCKSKKCVIQSEKHAILIVKNS